MIHHLSLMTKMESSFGFMRVVDLVDRRRVSLFKRCSEVFDV